MTSTPLRAVGLMKRKINAGGGAQAEGVPRGCKPRCASRTHERRAHKGVLNQGPTVYCHFPKYTCQSFTHHFCCACRVVYRMFFFLFSNTIPPWLQPLFYFDYHPHGTDAMLFATVNLPPCEVTVSTLFSQYIGINLFFFRWGLYRRREKTSVAGTKRG